MKRGLFWLKALAATAVVAGLGAVATLVVLRAVFPEAKLRAWTVNTARRQLGREVRLDALDLGLSGLSLRGVEVSEAPDFSAGTFVRVESFTLRPSWRALLHGKFVVAAVAADGVALKVLKGADGRFNYETLASSAPATPASKPSGAPPAELKVRRAKVTRASVVYDDGTPGGRWSVSDLDLAASNLGVSGPVDLEVSGRLAGKAGARPVDAGFSFDGSVDAARGDRAAFTAVARRLVVKAEGLKASLSGKVAGLDAPALTFEGELSAAGKSLLTASGTASVGPVARFDLKAKTPGLDTTLAAKLLPGAGLPALDLPAADLRLEGSYAGDRAEVKTFRAAWSGGSVTASGSARGLGGAKPAYEGRASFGLDVPAIPPGRYPFLGLPPKVGVPAGRLEGEASYAGDEVKIKTMVAKVAQGAVSVSGAVRKVSSAKPVPELTVGLALSLPPFKAGDLPVAVPDLPASFAVPAMKVAGTVRLDGDDARLDGVTVTAKGASVRLQGLVAKALAGTPQPDLEVAADLDLPALTDRDLPFAGVPAGLRVPPSHWTAEVAYSPRLVRVKSLRLRLGHNDVDVSGTVTDPAGRRAFDLLLKCRSFLLEELTALTPETRDMKLAGGGFFALSVTGTKEKPVYAGKLQFKGLGATVAELPLSDFTGTVSFDERRLDAPNLKGKVADGTLQMDLTVKDYSRAPEIQLEASLDRFDLGRYLAAKNKLVAERRAAQAANGEQAVAKAPPISTRGHFSVGTLTHPDATVHDVKVGWDLRGVTPDLHELNGDANLRIGAGATHAAKTMTEQSKPLKVLLFPLLVVQKLGSRIAGFPDFNNIAINGIVGDYLFRDGVMTLRNSEMDADRARVSALGTIDLPAEKLDLTVTAQVAKVAPLDVAVTGTFSDPKTKLRLGKFISDGLQNLLKR